MIWNRPSPENDAIARDEHRHADHPQQESREIGGPDLEVPQDLIEQRGGDRHREYEHRGGQRDHAQRGDPAEQMGRA